MSFTSLAFLALLAIVLPLYAVLGHRWQNRLLLAASLVFYGWWDWRFLGLLFATTAIDQVIALNVDRRRHPTRSLRTRRLLLAASLASNLGTLAFFKYFGFFVDSFLRAAELLGLDVSAPVVHVILPVGISFYTFQTLSYTIDVYRDDLSAHEDFLDVLLFVTFFPQLVAGPIERASRLLPQVIQPRLLTWTGITSGAQLAFVGYFKKLVIADNMAIVANAAFDDPTATSVDVVLGVHAFALQIYADFSAYSDIARGVARIFGFELMVNFKLPYLARSPSDFWRRWHVSLSTWLRDYLYVPLGGNRRGSWTTARNLLVTMLLGGLWHGAAWHFVAWGAWHGLLLLLYRPFERAPTDSVHDGPRGLRGWLATALFFELTCFGWLLFRAESMTHVGRMLAAFGEPLVLESRNGATAARILSLGLPVLLMHLIQQRQAVFEPWRAWPLPVRVTFYVLLWFGAMLLLAPDVHDFIYFQF